MCCKKCTNNTAACKASIAQDIKAISCNPMEKHAAGLEQCLKEASRACSKCSPHYIAEFAQVLEALLRYGHVALRSLICQQWLLVRVAVLGAVSASVAREVEDVHYIMHIAKCGERLCVSTVQHTG
jgi:hypothetical protein